MDEKLCFSKEAPAFDAKDISQALGKGISTEGDRSRVDNVLSLLSSNVGKSLAEQMIDPSLVDSMSGSNFSVGYLFVMLRQIVLMMMLKMIVVILYVLFMLIFHLRFHLSLKLLSQRN